MKKIINSLLDLDFYKITMMQFAYLKFKDVEVEYAFKNRTDKKLAEIININDLKSQLDHVRTLSFKDNEIDYLSTLTDDNNEPYFLPEFLSYLKTVKLPEVTVTEIDGDYDIRTKSTWSNAILWETIVLSLVNELYYISKYSRSERRAAMRKASIKLMDKINIIDQTSIIFTEFGTRRRFSREWQEIVVRTLSQTLDSKNFMGTSNVYLSMMIGMDPVGTHAHEFFMIGTSLFDNSDDGIRDSHSQMLDMWYDMYKYDLSIALTDTFGTKFFFEDFGEERAKLWKGFRQDSGDPFEFGDKTIEFYKSHNIDPMDKLIIFSDGLNIDKILKLEKYFNGRIKVAYGWGTTLSNDMELETLSIVMKAIISNGMDLVKLSDNLNKGTGPEYQQERFKRIFGYTNINREETIV